MTVDARSTRFPSGDEDGTHPIAFAMQNRSNSTTKLLAVRRSAADLNNSSRFKIFEPVILRWQTANQQF